MIAVIDYGVGNLFSLCRSLEAIGQQPVVTGDPALLRQADKLFLPGVGAFADAAAKLRQTGLDRVIQEEAAAGKPLMGICLGMQLLFEESHEFGTWKGLGLIPGKVVPMEGVIPADYNFPHRLERLHYPREPSPPGNRAGECVYCPSPLRHRLRPGGDRHYRVRTELTAAWPGAMMGCQFHPEERGRGPGHGKPSEGSGEMIILFGARPSRLYQGTTDDGSR
ncbi:MAG: imidazole glycerol phosphate synthase subunit HisH [Evtepia sp.]